MIFQCLPVVFAIGYRFWLLYMIDIAQILATPSSGYRYDISIFTENFGGKF